MWSVYFVVVGWWMDGWRMIHQRMDGRMDDGRWTERRGLGWGGAVRVAGRVLEKPSPATGACTFFVTCAADGKALFWDIDVKRDAKKREFLFSPTYKINMNRGETHGTLAAIRFDFSPDVGPGGPTEYFCASTDGEVA